MEKINNQNLNFANNTENSHKIPREYPFIAEKMVYFVNNILFSKEVEVSLFTEDRKAQEGQVILTKKELNKQKFFKIREEFFTKYPGLKTENPPRKSIELKKIIKNTIEGFKKDGKRGQQEYVSKIGYLRYTSIQISLLGDNTELEDSFTIEKSNKEIQELSGKIELDEDLLLKEKIKIIKEIIFYLEKNIEYINEEVHKDLLQKDINTNLLILKRSEVCSFLISDLKLKLPRGKKVSNCIKYLILPIFFFKDFFNESTKIDVSNHDFRQYFVHLISVSHNPKKEDTEKLHESFLNFSDSLKKTLDKLDFLNSSNIYHAAIYNSKKYISHGLQVLLEFPKIKENSAPIHVKEILVLFNLSLLIKKLNIEVPRDIFEFIKDNKQQIIDISNDFATYGKIDYERINDINSILRSKYNHSLISAYLKDVIDLYRLYFLPEFLDSLDDKKKLENLIQFMEKEWRRNVFFHHTKHFLNFGADINFIRKIYILESVNFYKILSCFDPEKRKDIFLHLINKTGSIKEELVFLFICKDFYKIIQLVQRDCKEVLIDYVIKNTPSSKSLKVLMSESFYKIISLSSEEMRRDLIKYIISCKENFITRHSSIYKFFLLVCNYDISLDLLKSPTFDEIFNYSSEENKKRLVGRLVKNFFPLFYTEFFIKKNIFLNTIFFSFSVENKIIFSEYFANNFFPRILTLKSIKIFNNTDFIRARFIILYELDKYKNGNKLQKKDFDLIYFRFNSFLKYCYIKITDFDAFSQKIDNFSLLYISHFIEDHLEESDFDKYFDKMLKYLEKYLKSKIETIGELTLTQIELAQQEKFKEEAKRLSGIYIE